MYWEFVEHLSRKNDKYGFVNEHEIRIATGIVLVLGIFSFFLVLFKASFLIPLFMVGAMWLDFVLKVFVSPKVSLFSMIVRPFVQKREPLWVGAVQKRFAWSLWLFLSTFVMFCLLILWRFVDTGVPEIELVLQTMSANVQSGKFVVTPMNPAIIACVICIVFMWLESVAGYCVWCSIYAVLVRKWWMKKHTGQNCANGACGI